MGAACSCPFFIKNFLMTTARVTVTLLLACSASLCWAQRLPRQPNVVDSKGQRQGSWVIWMNDKWEPVSDSSETLFYRAIKYKDDKPLGMVTDYFRNGQKQYEGILLADRPEEILDGVHTWYYASGQKRIIESYSKGASNNDAQVFLKSGAPADENWINHYKKGEQLSDENKYEESMKEFLIALENVEAYFDRASEEYATVADWLGIVSGLAGHPGDAIRFKEEFVEVRKQIRKPPDTLMVRTLADLGVHYKLQKNWLAAKRCFRDFLDQNSRFFGGAHPDFPEAIQTYGTVCAALREYDNALAYLTDAKKIFDKSPADYEYPRLSNLFSLSTLYMTMGSFSKGEQMLLQELPALKKKYGDASEYYITALGTLARIHLGSGQYKLAEQEEKEQLKLIKLSSGENSTGYASTLGSLAELYMVMGDLPQADKSIQEANRIYQKAGTADETYFEFLQKLYIIYGAMGNKRALGETMLKRKELAMKLFGKNSIAYARTLHAAIDAALSEKNYPMCEALAKEALAIYAQYDVKTLEEVERNSLALIRSTLGTIYLLQNLSTPSPGRLASARESLEEALRLFNLTPNRFLTPEITDAYLTLAMVYESSQQPQKADHYYNYVLQEVRKQWGEWHPYLTDVLFLIAKKSEIRKDYSTSFQYYKQAISHHQDYVQKVFPYLSETEKEQFYENNKLMLRSFQGFASQYADRISGLAATWYDVVLSQKGIILESFQPIRDAIFASNDESLKRSFADWQKLKNEFARQIQQNPSVQELMALTEKLNVLEKEISTRSKDVALDVRATQKKWTDVQKALTPGSVAIEILYAIEDREEGYDSAYHALILKPGSKQPIVVRIVKANVAEGKALRLYRNSIMARLEDLSSYDTYWKPLEAHLAGVKTIFLSVDGVYHQINPAALFNPKTKKFLSDELNFVSLPSTSKLVVQRRDQKISQATLFAHPDYGAMAQANKTPQLSRSLDLDNVSELPGTEKELKDIVGLLDGYKTSYQQFEGANATEDQLKKIRTPDVLHIATHGYFLPAPLSAGAQPVNPLLQSGVLLAGCQKKPHLTDAGRDDGILTAFEASTLPLYNTKLVILSACETGLGEIRNGEGVYGLQRAFFMAGAQRVLMSLWKVDDEATHQFMVGFYDHWLKHENIHEAYQAAQLAVKSSHPEPYYWAAFVLSGN
jgi:CHAT domain-containing protein